MLMKAVAAVKADKAKAIDMFNKGYEARGLTSPGFLQSTAPARELDEFGDGKEAAFGRPPK